MTREEAIKELEEDKALYMPEEWIESLDRDTPDGRLITALDMAIKALEQEPCEDCCNGIQTEKAKLCQKSYLAGMEHGTCEDAISRQAVDTLIDELARAISDERCYLPQRGRDTGTIMQNILDLPPVTPQPKTGHWEWVQYDYNPKLGNWHCSECRSIVIVCVDKNEKGGIPLYKYCPNCGTKMVEPQESEG